MSLGKGFSRSFKCLEEMVRRSHLDWDKAVDEDLTGKRGNIIGNWMKGDSSYAAAEL